MATVQIFEHFHLLDILFENNVTFSVFSSLTVADDRYILADTCNKRCFEHIMYCGLL